MPRCTVPRFTGRGGRAFFCWIGLPILSTFSLRHCY
uniref:Uncharacterized protein n=1 Tax=Setaria viridis TaxID=4556 RepID=A0A4U6T864_SETVI|nr:hypothetical protein SEVIR_9G426133v2 [Setaria viridis]